MKHYEEAKIIWPDKTDAEIIEILCGQIENKTKNTHNLFKERNSMFVDKILQKMLDEKLNHLPLKESIELYKLPVIIGAELSWVMHSEELVDNGEYMTIEEAIAEHHEIYGEEDKDYLKVGNPYNEFDEFTLRLVPAPTYMELLKYKEDEL